jgi:hypothetical protein
MQLGLIGLSPAMRAAAALLRHFGGHAVKGHAVEKKAAGPATGAPGG